MRNNKKTEQKNNSKNPMDLKSYKKKRLIYKFKIIMFYLSLFVIFIVAGVVLSLTVMFKIDDINIYGQTRYDNKEISSRFEKYKGKNLFMFDVQSEITEIKKEMPYIEEIEIFKNMPNKVSVSLKEAEPSAIVESNNKYIVISSKAKILETRDDMMSGLAVIRGIETESEEESGYLLFKDDNKKTVLLNLINLLKENNFKNISEINIDNLLNIFIVYDNRIKILLGDIDNMDYKIKNADFIIKNKIGEKEKGTLNLSTMIEDGKSYFMPEYVNK